MKRFSDESGWLRVVVCFAVLLAHHGLRDSLLTALPYIAASTTPTTTSKAPPATTTPPTSNPAQGNEAHETSYTTRKGKQVEETLPERNSLIVSHSFPISDNAVVTAKQESSNAEITGYSYGSWPTGAPSLAWVKESEVGDQSESSSLPFDISSINDGMETVNSEASESDSFLLEQKVEKTRNEVDNVLRNDGTSLSIASAASFIQKVEKTRDEVDNVPRKEGTASLNIVSLERKIETMNNKVHNVTSEGSESNISLHEQKIETTNNIVDNVNVPRKHSRTRITASLLPLSLFTFRGGNQRTHNRLTQIHLNSPTSLITKYKAVLGDNSVLNEHISNIPGVVRSSSAPSKDINSGQGSVEKSQAADMEEGTQGKALASLREGYQLKEDWSLVLEGLVLSSVYWGWFFTALLADPLMDKASVGVVLSVSVGGSGLLGLLTHAASLGGPWALLGLRVVQGLVQGVSYPAVVRVLEGVPSAIRVPAALLVYLGPSLGTGVGACLGSLPHWYIATYVVGSLALLLTPLCLMLPRPPHAAPHKEMRWAGVLRCRGVWACVGVHVANTWLLYTLLVGLPLYLTYSHLQLPSAGGWVVAAVVVVVCVSVRLQLFLAAKLSTKRPTTALNRRRIPVVAGTVMVTAALITIATAGLDSFEVLVGVGVGLAGVGVGVTRVGYRLNVDDMAPVAAWRVTRVLDAAGVLTAALSPVVVCALAQDGSSSGWLCVWLVPLAGVVPAAAIHLFLLTSNPQSWDQTDQPSGPGENGAVGGVGGVIPVNGSAPTLSIGRQSFKSARSALTFKTARSRSRTRTLSCRTVDEDLDGDMYSVANSNIDYRSVADEQDQECISVASSSTFKSEGADMHSVVDEADGITTKKPQPGHHFGSMLVNGGTADRTSVWLSSHHDLVLEGAGNHAPSTRAHTHATNAIYGLMW